MSKVTANMTGFIGFGGQSVWLQDGDEHDTAEPIVKAHPEFFATPAKELAVQPKRRQSHAR